MSDPTHAAALGNQPAEGQAEGAAGATEPVQPLPDQLTHRALYSLPVEIVVCVGTARPPLGELLASGPDAVIVLDHRIDDPVDIRIGDRVVARGELQELDDGSGRLGVRLTEIAGPGGSF